MPNLTRHTLAELADKARSAPRHRSHLNLHPTLDDSVQRLAIAMEPDTYVRPHRHPQTWELYLPLAGSFKVVLFDNDGRVTECLQLGGEAGLYAYELPADTWHSVISLQSGSIIFEVKQGPYIQPTDADLAAWSPVEGDATVAAFRQRLSSAEPGQILQK